MNVIRKGQIPILVHCMNRCWHAIVYNRPSSLGYANKCKCIGTELHETLLECIYRKTERNVFYSRLNATFVMFCSEVSKRYIHFSASFRQLSKVFH